MKLTYELFLNIIIGNLTFGFSVPIDLTTMYLKILKIINKIKKAK